MALSAHAVEEIRTLPGRFPEIRSAVMPALDIAQEELGYLTPEAMSEVADLLRLDPGYVEGVATFYTLFRLAPLGRHHFAVCTNLSCALRGAVEICDHIKGRIGVHEFKEVSADGLFSVEEVECLGACEYAPMMRYEHRYHYDLTPEKVDALIDVARAAQAPAQRAAGPSKEEHDPPHPTPPPPGREGVEDANHGQ
jgi:NADH-quinone oxidoreductase subunit E